MPNLGLGIARKVGVLLYRLNERGNMFRHPAGLRGFPVLKALETRSSFYPASYPMGKDGLFPYWKLAV
jgi:hypothetical protein